MAALPDSKNKRKDKQRRANKKKDAEAKKQAALQVQKQAARRNPQKAEKDKAREANQLNKSNYNPRIERLEEQILKNQAKLRKVGDMDSMTPTYQAKIKKAKQEILDIDPNYTFDNDLGSKALNILYQEVETTILNLLNSKQEYFDWAEGLIKPKPKTKSKLPFSFKSKGNIFKKKSEAELEAEARAQADAELENEVATFIGNYYAKNKDRDYSYRLPGFMHLYLEVIKPNRAFPSSLLNTMRAGSAQENITFLAEYLAVKNKTLGYQLKMFFDLVSKDTARLEVNISDSLRSQIEAEALTELAKLRQDNVVVPNELKAYLQGIFPGWPNLPPMLQRKVQHYENALAQAVPNANQNVNQEKNDAPNANQLFTGTRNRRLAEVSSSTPNTVTNKTTNDITNNNGNSSTNQNNESYDAAKYETEL